MIIKEVVQIGNPILSKKSKTVKKIDSQEIKDLITNLTDSMEDAKLVGLSAVQIGVNLRVFVTEIKATKYRKPEELDNLRIYINPQIIAYSKSQCIIYEGCGSIANGDIFGPVRRPKEVIVEAHDENGKKFTLKAKGLLARVIQHEYDHLEGINFMEKVTDMRKLMNPKNYKKYILKSE